MEDLLDDEAGTKISGSYNPWRTPALIIEGIPLAVGLLGVLVNSNELKTFGFVTLAMLYFLGSWYLFKAEKFKVLDIIIAEVYGIAFSIIILGILFYIQNWDGYHLMMIINISTIMWLLPIALVLFLVRRQSSYEFTFSKKIGLRMLIYSLISCLIFDKWDIFFAS